jgi:hypothetical protein
LGRSDSSAAPPMPLLVLELWSTPLWPWAPGLLISGVSPRCHPGAGRDELGLRPED